jgi:hypothetical protein
MPVSRVLLLAFVLVFISEASRSQSTHLPAGSDYHRFIERLEIRSGRHATQFHSALKPLEREAAVRFLEQQDTSLARLTHTDRQIIHGFLQANPEWSKVAPDSSSRPLLGRIYAVPSDLYRYHSEDFFLSVNPVLDIRLGKESSNEQYLYLNTRGVEVRGLINQKVGFYSFLAENQGRFPLFVRQQMNSHSGAMPGEGWTKGFKDGGVDYFTARGYLTFQATRNIGFQFGQDRNFSGRGIRSLLLSDYANNYLFLKINTSYRWLTYQNLFASLLDYPLRNYGRTYDSKYAVMHHLGLDLHPRLQVGFFESVVFGRQNPQYQRGFELHYLNPVIFYRAVEHHIGDPDKVSVGMDWQWIISRDLALFGQFYADEFYLQDIRNDLDSVMVRTGLRKSRKYQDYASFRNKFAAQLGVKTFDIFGIENLDIQAEINLIRPFVYAHYDTGGSDLRPAASSSHYSQPLAHPMGANLREWAFRIAYRPEQNWEIVTHLFSVVQGRDTTGINFGGDIFRDYRYRKGDFNHLFLQGERFNTTLAEINLLYQFRPGWFLDLRWLYRTQKSQLFPEVPSETEIFSFGIRANVAPRKHFF